MRFGAQCAVPFGLGRTSDSVFETSGREGPACFGGYAGVGARKDGRTCRRLYGAWRASSAYSEREAEGHERAAAVVHPI
jgi:hypothetical protein